MAASRKGGSRSRAFASCRTRSSDVGAERRRLKAAHSSRCRARSCPASRSARRARTGALAELVGRRDRQRARPDHELGEPYAGADRVRLGGARDRAGADGARYRRELAERDPRAVRARARQARRARSVSRCTSDASYPDAPRVDAHAGGSPAADAARAGPCVRDRRDRRARDRAGSARRRRARAGHGRRDRSRASSSCTRSRWQLDRRIEPTCSWEDAQSFDLVLDLEAARRSDRRGRGASPASRPRSRPGCRRVEAGAAHARRRSTRIATVRERASEAAGAGRERRCTGEHRARRRDHRRRVEAQGLARRRRQERRRPRRRCSAARRMQDRGGRRRRGRSLPAAIGSMTMAAAADRDEQAKLERRSRPPAPRRPRARRKSRPRSRPGRSERSPTRRRATRCNRSSRQRVTSRRRPGCSSQAQDIARFANVDLATAADAVAKAQAGQAGPLAKLHSGARQGRERDRDARRTRRPRPPARPTYTRARREGMQARAGDAFGELSETIGEVFLPILDAVLPALIPIVQALGTLVKSVLPILTPAIRLLGAALKIVADVLVTLVNWLAKLVGWLGDAVEDGSAISSTSINPLKRYLAAVAAVPLELDGERGPERRLDAGRRHELERHRRRRDDQRVHDRRHDRGRAGRRACSAARDAAQRRRGTGARLGHVTERRSGPASESVGIELYAADPAAGKWDRSTWDGASWAALDWQTRRVRRGRGDAIAGARAARPACYRWPRPASSIWRRSIPLASSIRSTPRRRFTATSRPGTPVRIRGIGAGGSVPASTGFIDEASHDSHRLAAGSGRSTGSRISLKRSSPTASTLPNTLRARVRRVVELVGLATSGSRRRIVPVEPEAPTDPDVDPPVAPHDRQERAGLASDHRRRGRRARVRLARSDGHAPISLVGLVSRCAVVGRLPAGRRRTRRLWLEGISTIEAIGIRPGDPKLRSARTARARRGRRP